MDHLQKLCTFLAPKVEIDLFPLKDMESAVRKAKKWDISTAALIFGDTITRYQEGNTSNTKAESNWTKTTKECLSKLYPLGTILLNLASFTAQVF
jgi:hypothetical protein